MKQQKAKLIIDEDDKQPLPDNINLLDEMAETMWMEYFKPAIPLSPAAKRELRDKYNEVADKINKIAGMGRVIRLTPSTLWIASKSAEGLDSPPKKAPLMPTTGATKQKNVHAPGFKQLTQSKPPIKEPGKGGGLIEQILNHHRAGLSNKEIIALGFNKSTVARQVGEYKKRNAQ